MKRVTGLGGVFFKAQDPKALKAWYVRHLGLPVDDGGTTMLSWRDAQNPESPGATVWEPFPANTDYFAPSEAPFMLNYRVADLDAVLTQLRDEGIAVEKVQEESYGRFAWLMDPENNRIELWQPLGEEPEPIAFEGRALPETTFRDINLERSSFDDVSLTGATFTNISLRGARFSDINFAGATIEDANIEGLTINGWNVRELIAAAEKQKA